MNDHELAARLAEDAGVLLLKLRNQLVKNGAHPVMLKDFGDASAHEFLMEELKISRPDDFVLSEEGIQGDYSQKDRVWIVDPLDGTREYGEFPRDDWAVHVALVERGELVAGAVSIPQRDQVFSTAKPPVLPPPWELKNGGDGADGKRNTVRIAVSRTRPGRAASALYHSLNTEFLPMGSAGVKTMAVVEGIVDIYAHSGGQNEWDSAAPVAIARAAGLWTSHLDGSNLIYNRPDPYVENLIVCRPELAETCLEVMRIAGF